MGGLLNHDNLPEVLGIVLAWPVLYFLLKLGEGVGAWRRGADTRDKSLLARAMRQVKECDDELSRTEDERDLYRQKVGRRDYLLLSHGLDPPPDDGPMKVRSDESAP
jgi:hypothetical protein